MKSQFPIQLARETANYIVGLISPHCTKITIAGSIRRSQPYVGDIEILYVAKTITQVPPGEMIPQVTDKTHQRIIELIKCGELDLRLKKNGSKSFGQRVKLLVHTDSGIPVDLFSCKEDQWINNLVSRTGGKQTNITIASNAKRLGWNWLMSDKGFINRKTKEVYTPQTEEDIFRFVRIPYLEPHQRP